VILTVVFVLITGLLDNLNYCQLRLKMNYYFLISIRALITLFGFFLASMILIDPCCHEKILVPWYKFPILERL
jgi:hypothetical protein